MTFRCAHMTFGGVTSANCGICGPMTPDPVPNRPVETGSTDEGH